MSQNKITFKRYLMRIEMGRYRFNERFYRRIAWILPKRLVMWAYIRVVAHATTNEYGRTIVPELTAMDALDRFTGDHKL